MNTDIKILRPNISIIMPVYNVEKQLVKCLRSVFGQEFSGTFEVIAVEASSTDNSLTLLKSFQANEPRLQIIEHGIREELSTSRITGMRAAKGNYILHVDSDDSLLPGALENLFKICTETDADIVVFDYMREEVDGEKTALNNIKKKLITTDKLAVQQYFYGACWNKIVKQTLTEDLIYGEIGTTTSEDLLYCTEILLKANTICLLPESYYMYLTNSSSASFRIKSHQFLKDQIKILQEIRKIITRYSATAAFTTNILNYLEKFLYLNISLLLLIFKKKKIESIELIDNFKLLPEMTDKRINRLIFSMSNKYYSLLQVSLRNGLRKGIGIFLKSFKPVQ